MLLTQKTVSDLYISGSSWVHEGAISSSIDWTDWEIVLGFVLLLLFCWSEQNVNLWIDCVLVVCSCMKRVNYWGMFCTLQVTVVFSCSSAVREAVQRWPRPLGELGALGRCMKTHSCVCDWVWKVAGSSLFCVTQGVLADAVLIQVWRAALWWSDGESEEMRNERLHTVWKWSCLPT